MNEVSNKINNPIGGYFGWEFPMSCNPFPHEEGTLVNSGHGALQLILQSIGKISKVWIPYFTCDIVPDSLDAIQIPYSFYHINLDLEIADLPHLQEDEYLIYTNYFGIMDGYVDFLVKYYGSHLIVDNAQAFFAPQYKECHQIYSPRKFVGVPDGGIAVSPHNLNALQLDEGNSYDCCSHLLMRSEGKVTAGYEYFKQNDDALRNAPLTKMSHLTYQSLHSLDYSAILSTRRRNYEYLYTHLESSNGIKRLLRRRNLDNCACPMVYPYYTDNLSLRARLIKESIFVATYWPNVMEWCNSSDDEYALSQHLIPLPIDQRYNEEDMRRIINHIQIG